MRKRSPRPAPREGARERMRSQALPARIVSGLLLGSVTLAAAWYGRWAFLVLAASGLVLAAYELLRLASRSGIPVRAAPALAAVAAMTILPALPAGGWEGAVLTALALWTMIVSLRGPIEGRLTALAVTVFAAAYVGGLGAHLVLLRRLPGGFGLLMLVFAATWAADTFAFFVGVRWGRRRLAPHISPGKSVEGFVGGLVGATLVTGAVAHFLVPGVGWVRGLGVGLLLGAVSPVGDLLESLLKRNLHAKDASHAIPGHGGLLDRIDSLLVTAPVAYYLFRILAR